MTTLYKNHYLASINDPTTFWQRYADMLTWFKAPEQVLSEKDEYGIQRWFPDGELNTCFLAIDQHVLAGSGDKTALIYESPVTGTSTSYTYNELLDEVSHFAGALASLGVEKGHRVVIYMPMIPQAAIAMLAVARIGAIHSVVFGGFAPNELATRIDDAQPTVIVTASCGIEGSKVLPYKPMVDEAIKLAKHRPDHCVVFQREQCHAELSHPRDIDWECLVAQSEKAACTAVKATDPLYILYTSGTTGRPKGVVRDNGGHAVALNYSMQAIYNVYNDDVFWAASDVGWVVGHSYIVYGPLIRGATTVFYEGKPVGTPDAGAFWRVVEKHKVNILFAAPTAFRAIRKEDPDAEHITKYDIKSLRTIFMAGERLDPPTYHWTVKKTGKPVVDHWWQTETGWPICANPTGVEDMPVKPGSSSVPTAGFNVQVLNDQGQPEANGRKGAIVLKLPLPPGCMPTIWGDPNRFYDGYLNEFPGYYCSGDNGFIDDDGYVFIMGRSDDVINVAGHRLSTGEMEEILTAHPAIAECSVIGVADKLKGQIPVGLVLLKDGVEISPVVLEKELVAKVRQEIGPIACFKRAVVVSRLPKTRSGKILRKLIRQVAANETIQIPSTIDDPVSVSEITEVMRVQGLVQGIETSDA
jgi:propionyl-CoA synthetase